MRDPVLQVHIASDGLEGCGVAPEEPSGLSLAAVAPVHRSVQGSAQPFFDERRNLSRSVVDHHGVPPRKLDVEATNRHWSGAIGSMTLFRPAPPASSRDACAWQRSCKTDVVLCDRVQFVQPLPAYTKRPGLVVLRVRLDGHALGWG